jgi:CheY-like chemotaxis protein
MILFVEDDAVFAYAACRYLETLGYRTLTVNSSMAALEQLESGTFALVITDIRLLRGEPHGLSLARMIRNKTPKLPIILVTAYPELLEGESAVPGRVFHKPVELSALGDACNSALAN